MRDILNTKILLSGATIIAAAAIVIGATYAFFSDTETSTGNVLAAGAVDLKIDNTSFYNGVANIGTSWTSTDLTNEKFFDFQDVKPSDYGEDTISVLVETNDAWVCADVTLTSNEENNRTANEIEDGDVTDDPDGGELADRINFIWWADDGDNVLETDENILPGGPLGALDVDETATVALADSIGSIYDSASLSASSSLIGEQTYYIGKAWCFGAISADPLPQANYGGPDENNDDDSIPGTPSDGGFACDSSQETNVTQTDSLTADISFRAVQSRNNPGFVCDETPVEIACTSLDNIFASSSSDNDQGRRKDGTAVLANRSIPSAAFGPPETSGADSDVGVFTGQFFSLGFPNVAPSTASASIVFGFDEPFYNGPGMDLQVFEVTGGVYPDEKVKIEASKNGTDWTLLAAAAVRDESVDLGVLDFANFVRLTDVSDIALFPDDADGYDVDALKAFCTEVEQQ